MTELVVFYHKMAEVTSRIYRVMNGGFSGQSANRQSSDSPSAVLWITRKFRGFWAVMLPRRLEICNLHKTAKDVTSN